MPKYTCAVFLFVQLVLQVQCLYEGDSCVGEEQSGTCILLSQCQNLVADIKRAGNPMPQDMRNRLQGLTCGFVSKEPLVCCVTTTDRDGGPSQNTGETNDIPEDATRRSIDNISGPKSVLNHPNLHLLPKNCGFSEAERIIGGVRPNLMEMPWMVLLSYKSPRGPKLSCGGSLINEWYVLTAAHCVAFLDGRLTLDSVVLGEYDIRVDPDCEWSDGEELCAAKIKKVKIDQVIPHPEYTRKTLLDDIALLRLSEPTNLKINSTKPICLPYTPETQTESLDGKISVVAGWGVTEEGVQSDVLLKVDLPILSNKDCQAAFNGSPRIYDRQICAGAIKDKDSCGGDSGSPLTFPGVFGEQGVRDIQRGIVSYGPKMCGRGNLPGVYTNVAYYMEWILDNMSS